MARSDEETNLLLESIRNELVSIIEDDEPNGNRPKVVPPAKNKDDDPLFNNGAAGDASNIYRRTEFSKPDGLPLRLREGYLEPHCSKTIDEDLQSMHVNLKESYELFQAIGERFENINFGCLKSRIKDLHLTENNTESIKTIVNDIKTSFDKGYNENRLNDLTTEVKSKFRKHPGEFGDIPELSEFFKACSQLQHGLERLKRERRGVQELSMRMSEATDASFCRIEEMHCKMKEK